MSAPKVTYTVERPSVIQTPVAPASVVKVATGQYFVDFGRDLFGTLKLTFPKHVIDKVLFAKPSVKSGGQQPSTPEHEPQSSQHAVTVALGERLAQPDHVDGNPKGSIRFQQQTLELVPGQYEYTVKLWWRPMSSPGTWIPVPSDVGQVMPFRYAQLYNIPEPFDGASQIRHLATHVPFDDSASSFDSSDDVLNQVWRLCEHTITATSYTGVGVDGDRERKPYEADAYINNLGCYCVAKQYDYARYTHEYLMEHPTWPTEWVMHSILLAWADYMYTGDKRSLEANYLVLVDKLMLGKRRSDGLFCGTTPDQSRAFPRDIVDWPPGERDGYDMSPIVKTVVCAFHYRTLELMSQIADVVSKPDDAAKFASMAEVTLRTFNSVLWDKASGRYVDGVSATGTLSTHASVHANMFPLAFGMVPEERKSSVAVFVKSRGMACSVYGAQYLLEALYASGQEEHALHLLNSTAKRSWYNMIRVGSTMTMEAWDLAFKGNLTWNHVWGSVPANIIPRCLMGIQPLEPGFTHMTIRPRVGSLATARVKMPTPLGPVVVHVQRNTSSVADSGDRAGTTSHIAFSVHVPSKSVARVGLPSFGSTDVHVTVDGVERAGQVEGDTVWIDGVSSGHHDFERSVHGAELPQSFMSQLQRLLRDCY